MECLPLRGLAEKSNVVESPRELGACSVAHLAARSVARILAINSFAKAGFTRRSSATTLPGEALKPLTVPDPYRGGAERSGWNGGSAALRSKHRIPSPSHWSISVRSGLFFSAGLGVSSGPMDARGVGGASKLAHHASSLSAASAAAATAATWIDSFGWLTPHTRT